jgi:hypothetical protein
MLCKNKLMGYAQAGGDAIVGITFILFFRSNKI